MNKRVGILTFHASHNYGSMLQSYALKTYIEGVGIQANVINLRIAAQKEIYANPLRFWGVQSILSRLSNPRLEFANVKKWYKFERFLTNYIKPTNDEFHSWEDLLESIPNLGYYAIICGGDQIWNTFCGDYNESYFLPSTLSGIKKISYSPSMGGIMSRFSDPITNAFIKRCLEDFDAISVRDLEGQSFLEELLCSKVPVVPDPTILITRDGWDSLVPSEPIIKGDYILYYSPFSDPRREALAIRYGQKMKTRVVITNADKFTYKSFWSHNECGPLEFLNLLKNAKFVCGHSYHLAVFSLIFHKEFVAFDGDSDARINGLLSMFDLKDRGISADSEVVSFKPLDIKKIDRTLLEMRKQGESYIKAVLQ